jgi:hypothetical protein
MRQATFTEVRNHPKTYKRQGDAVAHAGLPVKAV